MTLSSEIKSLEDIQEIKETQLVGEANSLLRSGSWRLLGFNIERIRNPVKGSQQQEYRFHGSDVGKGAIYTEKTEVLYILGRYR
jgi:hypothetical protein